MKHSLLTASIVALTMKLSVAATYTIGTSGFTFNPSTLNVTDQDTIIFNVGGGHNATEVSQATWNLNSAAPLSGGFAFTGSNNVLTNLTAGTRYFVCTPHVGSGMKGQIVISSTVGIKGTQAAAAKRFYPNPIKDQVTISLQADEKAIRIVDMLGNTISQIDNINESIVSLDALAHQPKGIYFAIIYGKQVSTLKLIKE